ncbi:MAG: TldD/PmbA family protein, partial [Chloroflexi bacterium]|nr:TldD/PmbA family protein [Chloroflexota bacterium]
LLERILDRARRVADEAEVFYTEHREEPARFEANRLKQLLRRDTVGVALRVIKNGHVGLASTSRLDSPDALVDMAAELAPLGPEASFSFAGPAVARTVATYDEAVPAFPAERMVELTQESIDRLLKFSPELVCNASVGKEESLIRVMNTRGASYEYRKTGYGTFLEATRVRGTDMLFVWQGKSSGRLDTDLSEVEGRIQEYLTLSEEIVPTPTGDVPVLFTPRGVSAALIQPLLAGFNGRALLQKTSPLVERFGQRIVDERITMVEDPTLDFAAGARPVDDEGVPTKAVTLVDHGVARQYLSDLQTAAALGSMSTGSAHRMLGSMPAPASSVALVEPGRVRYQDLVAGMDRGLIVEVLLGAGQSNLIGGDFQGNVLLGFAVEKGRITGRVKDTLVSGNVYHVLSHTLEVGSEAQGVGGAVRTPAVLCRGVSVSAKA